MDRDNPQETPSKGRLSRGAEAPLLHRIRCPGYGVKLIRELVGLCDGLPLALRIVGERLARRTDLPPALLARHLARRPLDALQLDELSVRERIAADYKQVAAEDAIAGRVLPLLGQLEFDASGTPEELASKLDEDPSRVFFALERLVDAWLAVSPKPNSYRTAGLLRIFAEQLTVG